jgi:hypothetical protein
VLVVAEVSKGGDRGAGGAARRRSWSMARASRELRAATMIAIMSTISTSTPTIMATTITVVVLTLSAEVDVLDELSASVTA